MRTINIIELLNEGFRYKIKTQAVLSCTETVPMLLGEVLASGHDPCLGRLIGRQLHCSENIVLEFPPTSIHNMIELGRAG